MLTYRAADGSVVMADFEFFTSDMEEVMIASAAPSSVAALEKHFAAARAAEQAMNERATSAQRAIGYGDCVTRQWQHPGHGELTIYGAVLTLDLVAREEQVRGASDREIAALTVRLDIGYARGWRYGRWHSAISPEGEYGAAHVADLTPITAAEFDAAQFAGWLR